MFFCLFVFAMMKASYAQKWQKKNNFLLNLGCPSEFQVRSSSTTWKSEFYILAFQVLCSASSYSVHPDTWLCSCVACVLTTVLLTRHSHSNCPWPRQPSPIILWGPRPARRRLWIPPILNDHFSFTPAWDGWHQLTYALWRVISRHAPSASSVKIHLLH